MRLSLVSLAAACACANAFDLKQVFFGSDAASDDVAGTSLFDKLAHHLDRPDVTENPLIKSAWDQLQKQFSSAELQRKVDQFNDRFAVKTANLNNKFRPKTSDFEVFALDKFDGYSLRVKETHPELLGLDSVNQYTGYLDVEKLDKHFFYWFFESRNDPKNDPVILWLNGGPGCSSSTGLFFELGPSSINATLQPVYNPYSWNSNASVIFLDQPVGVGYSYTGGEEIKNTAAAAKDVYIFLELFFQKFPQFQKNDFHIAGESYAGHYIPNFAVEIISNADRSFDLTSVLIGNGITDPKIQYGYYKGMACGEGGYKPVLSEETCERMEEQYPRCSALASLCYAVQNALTCIPAYVYCENSLLRPYIDTGLNPYDIRKSCEDDDLCYEEMNYMEDYLNLEFVKDAVGATVDIYTSCDDTVIKNFVYDGDEMKPFQQYVAQLLEADIPVLLYAGDKDFICNWLGNHAWSDALEWSGGEEFKKSPLKPWLNSDGKEAGQIKNYGKFSFLRIYDAGHMVPYDQPQNSLEMVNNWIHGDYAFQK